MTAAAQGYYRVGVADICVRGAPADIAADVQRLYRGYARAARPDGLPIDMDITAVRAAWGRRQYTVGSAGHALGRAHPRREVLPYLEWGVNWAVIRSCTHVVQFHAATLVHDGRAVVIAGSSGAGKSTLAAGLLARGWRYATDELTLVDPQSLCVQPYPKPICIKQGAFDAVRRLGLPLWAPGRFVKALKGEVGYINPYDVSAHPVAGACPIAAVVFPRYAGRGPVQEGAVAPGRAAVGLLGCMLNRNAFGERAVTVVGRLVRRVPCWRLESGDLDAACTRLEDLVLRRPTGSARIDRGPRGSRPSIQPPVLQG